MTEATMEINYGDNTRRASVSIDRWDMTLEEVLEEVILPLLKAHGFYGVEKIQIVED